MLGVFFGGKAYNALRRYLNGGREPVADVAKARRGPAACSPEIGSGPAARKTGPVTDYRLGIVDEDAVRVLRAALTEGRDPAAALTDLAERYPAFGNALFGEALLARFGWNPDVRLITSFVRKLVTEAPAEQPRLPAREAEALIRIFLGEGDLAGEAGRTAFDVPAVQVAIMRQILTEWSPGAAEVADLLDRAEAMAMQLREHGAELIPAIEQKYLGGPDPGGAPPGPQPSDVVRDLTQRGLDRNALGRPEDALACFDRAIGIDPGHAAALAGRGDALCMLGRYQEAIRDFGEALRRDPACYPAVIGRATTFLDMDDLDGALAEFGRAISLAPREPGGFAGRGQVCLDLGRYDEALADFSTVIELEPGNALAMGCRSMAYRELGMLQNAIGDLSAAIGIDPAAWLFGQRGRVYQDLGRLDEAVADYSRAIAIDPHDAVMIAMRADAYREQGRDAAAAAELERAFALDPTLAGDSDDDPDA